MKIILKKGRGSQLSDSHKPATVKHIDSVSKNGHFPVYHYFLKPFLNIINSFTFMRYQFHYFTYFIFTQSVIKFVLLFIPILFVMNSRSWINIYVLIIIYLSGLTIGI